MRRKLKNRAIPSRKPGTDVKDITKNGQGPSKAKTAEIGHTKHPGIVTEEHIKTEDEFSQIDEESEAAQQTDTNLCRVCQSDLLPDAKHLLEPAVARKSYADVIGETLHIQVICDGDANMRICEKCSSFIKDLYSFAKLCRDSLTEMKLPHSNLNTVSQELSELEKGKVLEIQIETIDTHETQSEASSQLDPKRVKYVDPKQCDICGVFIKQDLQLHKKTHFNVSVKCDVCGKTYSNARQLQVHMNVHTKNIPYPCQFCDKVFYVWRSQKDHEQTHLDKINNVEHRCTECDNVYATKKQLEVHFKLKHLGIRKYACQHCNFKTNLKDRLLHHVRATHTDKRPYGCTACDNTTSNDSNHYIHFKRHKKKGESTEYQIKCAYCGKVFTKDAVFEMHLVDDHPEEAVIV